MAHFGNSLVVSSNVKRTHVIWPSHPIPRAVNGCTQIFIVALFITAQNWKQSTCPPTGEENVAHHIMDYYLRKYWCMQHEWIVNALLGERSQTIGMENRSVFGRSWGEKFLTIKGDYGSGGYTTLDISNLRTAHQIEQTLLFVNFVNLHTVLKWGWG